MADSFDDVAELTGWGVSVPSDETEMVAAGMPSRQTQERIEGG